MITPQQIDQVAFKKASFGGYNMQQVDEFLEPLTEDYVTLFKENALLKSKLRVLAGKLEEYRKSEGTAKASGADAQAERDKMLAAAKAQCDKMLKDANAKAQQITAAAAAAAAAVPTAAAPAVGNADALVAAEQARVEEARKAANARIAEIQEQMRACIQALERIKGSAAAPVAPAAPAAPKPASFGAPAAPAVSAAPAAPAASFDSGSVADEISHNVEALVGTAEETAPKAEPRHPVNDTTTSRFANLNLQFGRNYDPTHK